jgi:hypothetical protein
MAGPSVRLELNDEGLREYLRTNPELRAALEGAMNRGLDYAREKAPVSTAGKSARQTEYDYPGEYRDSLYAEIHVGPSRMSARVGSTSFKRYWIENGSIHNAAQHVLAEAQQHMTL